VKWKEVKAALAKQAPKRSQKSTAKRQPGSPKAQWDLLDHLPLHACVELTRWLLTSISSLPTGEARPCAVLKTVILFIAEYGTTP